MLVILPHDAGNADRQQNQKKHMAQHFKQSENYSFTVEAAPSFMQLPDGTFVKDGFTVNRRTDNLAVLGKVTDRYGLVQNADLLNAAEEAFHAQSLTDYTRKIIVAGEGERLYAVYDFRAVTRAMKVGDEVGLRLTVQNSFDGSLRASFLAGMLRLICKNGMVTVDREVGLTQKHGSKISVDFVREALVKALGAWEKSVRVFDRLAEVNVSQLEGAFILNRLAESNVLSGKLLEGISAIWAAPTHREDTSRNLFNLYNAVTQHLTHGVAGERFELADRVSRNVLSALHRAASDSAKLAKLVAPIAIPA